MKLLATEFQSLYLQRGNKTNSDEYNLIKVIKTYNNQILILQKEIRF